MGFRDRGKKHIELERSRLGLSNYNMLLLLRKHLEEDKKEERLAGWYFRRELISLGSYGFRFLT
jgi:hypothetical protein